MSESQTPDLGRIINLIMENPKIIEEISNLAKADAKPKEAVESLAPEEVLPRSEIKVNTAPVRQHSRRGELLTLLKPYLSEKRASAIDSMVSVADVLKIMKRGD